ncbi:uncharacterized protein MKK02DRAFT_43398 [Dioszegia hungarica]|uniref:Ribosomal protein S6 n=1 Tax=Dioszegia hungarica TaxID=4972 RepID=A0AA38HD61_9TREE|nr:uncharacterized protein MKK02DRAFT_43398 [Dioszegia hungarica]KAI9637474.1 hypothetical protein MKK02DRAFT_43398 [Dioszegia hungarica]
MPLYELFCIASHNPTSPANLRQLIDGIARQIHSSGGVVRDMKSLGVGLTLPMRMRANQQYHTRGDHFTMLFDTSPPVLKRLEGTLRADPLVVRWTTLKKGEAIKDLNPTPDPTIKWEHPTNRSYSEY